MTFFTLLGWLGWQVGPVGAEVLEPGIHTNKYTNVGIIGMTVTNLGYVGNGFITPYQPSGEYPLNSNVEHLFLGGIWVGAVAPDGSVLVSTGAQDASTLEAGDEIREFSYSPYDNSYVWSNSQNSDNYDLRAKATQHIQMVFHDYVTFESGSHSALGLKIVLNALAWSIPYADDFVILDYAIINISGSELRDVYVGFWNDTTVGHTDHTNPYDSQAAVGWNYYDDMNGGWGPFEWVDPHYSPFTDSNIWMMWEHDDDGDEGLATSWIGCRMLGSVPAVDPAPGTPPVSYNAWMFRHVPAQDDWYYPDDDPETLTPGKYQIMSNGQFTVGETQETNYTIPSDWVSLLSTGPFPHLAPEDTLHVTFAMVCGADSLSLLNNSKVAQVTYDDGLRLFGGPPSPYPLEFGYRDNAVILKWDTGFLLDPATGDTLRGDDPRRSPEYHLSDQTGKPDFQGYRVYSYQGDEIPDDPFLIATLVAQYDKIDGVGFDTGLPPLNENGQREVLVDNLLDGFPYWFSVTSYSAPDYDENLPEYPSGFNENATLVYPGPASVQADEERTVGVFPNPYRAASLFDGRIGEKETKRRIWFTGLPPSCKIQVFNLVGEVIKTIRHDDPEQGMAAWDLLTDHQRAIATGLYIYAVEDLDTGRIQRGKLVIIK